MDARWSEETKAAAGFAGWRVVETDGVDDYQGWGAHLLTNEAGRWAVMAWSYGSCSVCDEYEDRVTYNGAPEQHHAIFGELIEEVADEESARLKFSARKGW